MERTKDYYEGLAEGREDALTLPDETAWVAKQFRETNTVQGVRYPFDYRNGYLVAVREAGL